MKVLKTIEESDAEGLVSLMGQRITLFCGNYIKRCTCVSVGLKATV